MKTKQIKNPNSPENLLAPWMLQNMRRYFEMGNKGTPVLGRYMLAGILAFAEDNNKLVEMYRWINSDEGIHFFNSHDPEGRYVLEALGGLNISAKPSRLNGKIIDDLKLLTIIEKYIERNFYTFKYELRLI